METILTVKEKVNKAYAPIAYGQTLHINSAALVGHETKNLYIRTGQINGTLYLSQRNFGSNGAGDICKLYKSITIEVNTGLFERIKTLATKANAIISNE